MVLRRDDQSGRDAPYLPEIGVLALVPDDFDEPWQSRHQILTRLSAYFPVVWVEPPPGRRDMIPYLVKKRSTFSTPAFAVQAPSPWLPLLSRPAWLARFLERRRLARALRTLVKLGCSRVVLSIWRPQFEPALSAVAYDLATYHIDDEYSFSIIETPPDQRELRLIEAADVVLVHSPRLMQRKGHLNPVTVYSPNGVDYEAYRSPMPEPADLAVIPHPRVGYTGYLKWQLDWALLRELIVSHREWQFVFVGPQRPYKGLAEIIHALSRAPNVHFLPPRGQKDLAAYPQHFDVCTMPYIASAYTECIYPLKLHEYLASGRPVVGTRLPTLEEFADVVTLASTVDEWSSAIAEALSLASRDDSRRAERQRVASRHDWGAIVERIARAMAAGIGTDEFDRLERALELARRDERSA